MSKTSDECNANTVYANDICTTSALLCVQQRTHWRLVLLDGLLPTIPEVAHLLRVDHLSVGILIRLHGMVGDCSSESCAAKLVPTIHDFLPADLLHVLKVELGGGPLGDRGASSLVAVFGKIPQELVEDLKWSVPKEFLAPLLEKKREPFFDDLGTFAFVFKELMQCDPRNRATASGASEMFSILAA